MINNLNNFEKIKILRERLNCIIKHEGLCSENVLLLSREVDKLILEYYHSTGTAKKMKQ